MAALEGADRASRAPAHDAIDGAGVKSSAPEPALDLHNHGDIHATAVWVVGPVRIRVIGIRVIERKERKTEVIENNDLIKTATTKSIISIEVAVVETVEATKPIVPSEVAAALVLEAGCGV